MKLRDICTRGWQMQTVGGEKAAAARTDKRTRNSQTPKSEDKKHGDLEEVLSSDRKLRWSLQRLSLNCQISGWKPCEAFVGITSVMFSSSSVPVTILHLLFFAMYKENIEEQCKKNLSAVILFLMSRKDRWWLVCEVPACTQGFCNLFPAPLLGLGCLYSRTATIRCSSVTLGQTAGKELWEASIEASTPHLASCTQA